MSSLAWNACPVCRGMGVQFGAENARMAVERPYLQPLAVPWRGDIAAARPQAPAPEAPAARPAIVVERIAEVAPAQHPLAVYEQLLMHVQHGVAA